MISTILKLFKSKCKHEFEYNHIHLEVHGLQPTHIVEYCEKCGTSKQTFVDGTFYYSKMLYPYMFKDKDGFNSKKYFDNISKERYDYCIERLNAYKAKNPYLDFLLKDSQK